MVYWPPTYSWPEKKNNRKENEQKIGEGGVEGGGGVRGAIFIKFMLTFLLQHIFLS